MIKLYIDDVRNPKESGYTIIRTYSEAVGWMRKNGCPEFISFDHDLGTADNLDGIDVAKWIVKRDLDANGQFIPAGFDFFVHSANPVGAANITGLINGYLKSKTET